MKKLNILIINWQCIKNPFGGGAEVHFHEIFKRVASLGHTVTLFCCEFDRCEKEEILDGIKIIRKGKRSTFNYGVRSEYLNRFANEEYDIVIDDINKIPFYTPLYVKKPLLAISHHFFGTTIFREASLPAALYVYLAEKTIDFIYKKTEFAVVSKSTLDEFLSRGFDKNKFSIVPNAIHQAEFPMTVIGKSQKPIISYFGRLKKYKSVDHLLKAFALIEKKFPEAELYILGKGDFRDDLEKLARELNIEDKTTFFGFVSNEDKVKLLSKSWAMVNTSMKEGWGITNIEANACGTLVISADVPGLRDSVKDNLSGLLYEYADIKMLADKLELIIVDKEKRNELSEGAIEWASSFSWDESANMMIDRMYEVIESNTY